MAVRTNNDDVNALMDTISIDYTLFINLANQVVDENLVGEGLVENALTRIELFLAAHYAVIAKEKGGITRAAIGQTAESYRAAQGQGIGSTWWGQQALAIDSTGTLAAFGIGGLQAEFEVV